MSVLRVVRPVEPIAVEQARPGVGKVAMPDEVGALEQLDALHLAPPLGIEETQLDALGVLGEQREIDARPFPGGAEGIGPAAPERARRDDDAGRRFHSAVANLRQPLLLGIRCRAGTTTGRAATTS